MTTAFPGNSKSPKGSDPKKIESVVTGEVSARKKSLGRRFKELFIGGDSKSVMNYIFMDVLVPQAKDMMAEAASQGFERLIYGESKPGGRRFGPRPSGPVNYSRYSMRGNNPIGRSVREDRIPTAQPKTNSIDDILFATRLEADTVLERLYDLLGEYENVSISDLYSLIGWSSTYIDQKWGWTDLHGSNIRRVRDGYILDLPRPQSLD